jgi:site-specific DNA-methyltransferase (adenine-specific)
MRSVDMNKVHFSSESAEWSTPSDFFAKVEAEFGPFDLDPCATAENAKARMWYDADDDGLSQSWVTVPAHTSGGDCLTRSIWLNPVYGREISKWILKAVYAFEIGVPLIVMLLPARTDTRWWHDYVIPYASEIRFIRGRLKFGGSKNSAPFPSALVIFRRAK